MSRPDKCKWCGATIKSQDIEPGLVVFMCDSWVEDDGREYQWIKCKLIIAEHRIAAAIAAAKQANRFDMVTERGDTTAQPDSTGCYAWASVLDDIALILTGNSPEIPEGLA